VLVAEETNIQLCGRLIVRLDGRRVEDELPGGQGRMLFGFLALHRSRFVSREKLVEALWGERLPSAPETALRALLSKSRTALGANRLEGKGDLRLVLPATASIDIETASEAIHDADAAVSQGKWRRAWVASHIAVNIARRQFLAGLEARWIDEQRRQMDELHERGLESLAAAGLGIGGPELDLAERAARSLVGAAPFRESGHRLLIEILAAKGNIAESLLAYESLRQRVRKELGSSPSAELQDLHTELLRRSGAPRLSSPDES
jgi:SARP family transcriptional regulator, regulator of embCAB operon